MVVRVPEAQTHIIVDDDIQGGTPVIRGTRIMVYALRGRIDHGDTVEEILKEYPYLTPEAVEEAIAYARLHPELDPTSTRVRDEAQKREALKQIAKRRQQSRMKGYRCLHEIAGGVYECDYVSPWSKSAHDVNSSVMIVGQDWSSEEKLNGPLNSCSVQLGYDPRIFTNKNLQRLLRQHCGMAFADVYATNAFPFIKAGGMQGGIVLADMRQAVKDFLLPQIEIVQPRVVICLGLSTFNAVRQACKLDTILTLGGAISAPFDYAYSRIVAVAHTGARGTNNRGRDLIEKDWESIGRFLKETSL